MIARVGVNFTKVDVKSVSFEDTSVESDFDEFCIIAVNKDAEYSTETGY
jgi:hypothetical protein